MARGVSREVTRATDDAAAIIKSATRAVIWSLSTHKDGWPDDFAPIARYARNRPNFLRAHLPWEQQSSQK